MHDPQASSVQPPAVSSRETSIWPRYDAAVLGFRNYWCPVMWSRKLGSKPVSVTMLGDPLMFIREQGKPYALFDQCSHRGIPLSVGRREFPGTCTWTCRYHGWTYDLKTGVLLAALTDGPDSPICGKVRVKTYPVQERAGLVWAYMGDGEPPPLEEDAADLLLHDDTVVVGRITVQKGNWRYAVENSFDAGHPNYLHRYGVIHSFFRRMPGWTRSTYITDGPWLTSTRRPTDVFMAAEYPGLGKWPRHRFWNVLRRKQKASVRLPGYVQLAYEGFTHAQYIWPVAVDKDHYRLFQFYVTRARGLEALRFKLTYYLYLKWAHHIQFNNQDTWMVRLMPETPPERLFRPDRGITAWRKLCEHARGQLPAAAPLEEQLKELEVMS